ncbi:MAG: TetR/AcrR family transcriptional regulator [Bacteroidota bacterium]
MGKIKQKILDAALDLYNRKGVSEVSIRQIAKEVSISHSNLIYHYPGHEDLIVGLHEVLLQKAVELNQGIDPAKSSLLELFSTTKRGFSVVLDFRFLFYDLKYICSSFPRVKQIILSVEKLRSEMYQGVIREMIGQELIRSEEFEAEYEYLISLIKIFSDHWLVSSSIYDELGPEEKLEKYAYLLMTFFYPYLTDKGKEEFKTIPKL